MFILFSCVSSSLFCLYIVIPIPSLYGFWHGASLHLHTFYGNVFYTCFTSFNIHCIHVCVDIVRKGNVCVVQPQQQSRTWIQNAQGNGERRD